MSLANWLNSEEDTVCLHEGKERLIEAPGKQWLPFLTLQNFQAYAVPQKAPGILQQTRGDLPDVLAKSGCSRLGDIAYNYAPFVADLAAAFPTARLLVLVRDGRDFVRSVITNEVPDPTPVGWLSADRKMTNQEKFIALGRLRPLPESTHYDAWESYSLIEKNAWLWAETYRLILDGVQAWPQDMVMLVKAEELFRDPKKSYGKIRSFLGIDRSMSRETEDLLGKPINSRSDHVLPHWQEWSTQMIDEFDRQADEMMQRLEYDRAGSTGGK